MNKIVTILAGDSFLTPYIVRELAKAKFTIRIISKNPEKCNHFKMEAQLGQCIPIFGNVHDINFVAHAIDGSSAIINLLNNIDGRKEELMRVNAQSTESLAKIAKEKNIEKFIHLTTFQSTTNNKSMFLHTKNIGEKAVLEAFPDATIIRSAIIFGKNDEFISTIKKIANISQTFTTMLGDGSNTIQPIYAGDLAKTIHVILNRPVLQGKIIEAYGDIKYTLAEIVKKITPQKKTKHPLVINKYLASLFSQLTALTPIKSLISQEKIYLLTRDNLPTKQYISIQEFGIIPIPLENVLHFYV